MGEARAAARRAGIRVTKTHGVFTERNRSTARRHRTRQRYHTVLSRLTSQRVGDPEVDLIEPDFLASADSHTLAEAIIRQATSLAGGFRTAFLDYFAEVGGGDPTSCTAALTRRSPVIVTDVTQDPIFAGGRPWMSYWMRERERWSLTRYSPPMGACSACYPCTTTGSWT